MRDPVLWDQISAGIMLAGAVLFGYQAVEYERLTGIGGLGVAVFVSGIVVALIKVRCPFCHRFLGIFGVTGDYCARCGGEIRHRN